MVKKFRNSSTAMNKLENFCKGKEIRFRTPQIDCATRWNSTHHMLDIMYSMKDALGKTP